MNDNAGEDAIKYGTNTYMGGDDMGYDNPKDSNLKDKTPITSSDGDNDGDGAIVIREDSQDKS